ncbi:MULTISPECIES: ABC transporter permease [Arthrobacter]|uniref:ABC transporter permease n=2 Tax=Arthrobacter TaxID=1663 RepID=A0ABU9KHX7_9MICC|nr:ABC transporter permease [Arthrobacter sp. YJM1]MDP5226503.1 ABC transporter permease [Arthrobacter sp. YJM1]
MTEIMEVDPGSQGPQGPSAVRIPARGYFDGIRDVVVLELKQRLRSRGWYIMLGIWFVVIGGVTWLTWGAWNAAMNTVPAGSYGSTAQHSPGSVIFEVVLAFVLLFALLVAPALSANGVNGDRSSGTLALLQVTLLTPGQILWGKFLAAWVAALAFLVTSAPFLIIGVAAGGLSPGHIVVSLLMLALEIAVVCAIGTGVSAVAARPLFSIVVTYLAVAGLTVLSVIAFGFGMQLTRDTATAMEPSGYSAPATSDGSPSDVPEISCVPTQQPVFHTERVAWFLAVNPFVVVADAIPYSEVPSSRSDIVVNGPLESISQGTRHAMAGPEAPYSPCVNGVYQPQQSGPQYEYLKQTTPVWPLGLGIQAVLAGLLLWLGWRSLRTPARRLPRGTRIA